MQTLPSAAKAILCLVIMALLLVGVLGVPHMGMDLENSQMSFCPLMLGPAICNMNPVQHIAAWQNMFTNVLQNSPVFILSALLLFSIAIAWLWTYLLQSSLDSRSKSKTVRLREEYQLPTPILQELFSSGILHPKIF